LSYFRQKRILIISPEPWQHCFVSKHHYAITLAHEGNTVFFLNPPGTSEGLSQSQYSQLHIVDYKSRLRGLNYLPGNLSRSLSSSVVEKILRLVGGAVDVVWSFDPYRFQYLELFSARVTIYFAADFHVNRKLEQRIASRAEVVLSPSSLLLQQIETSRPKYFLNHAVAEHFFDPGERMELPGSAPIRVGYAGNLQSKYIDIGLLREVIANNPFCDFVFAGDNSVSNARILSTLDNVYFVGLLSTEQVPGFLNACDVLFYCYDTETYAVEASNSHKILEYLASGRVVVGTRVYEYRDRQDLVISPKENKELPLLMRQVVGELELYNAEEVRRKRVDFARQHTYPLQLKRISEWIESIVGETTEH
jgi:glycosyltransferase involved in cell wall biosynthesis